jgi:hypothetical protein
MAGRIRRPSPAMIVACIALAVALGGVGYAATVLPANSVGALQLKPNAVNSSKVLNRSLLRVDFRANQIPAGPAGAAGPKGDKGDPGAPGTALWAIVHEDGSIDSPSGSSGVTAHFKTGTGEYRIQFNRSVASCAIVVTPAFGMRTIAAANQALSGSVEATDVVVAELDVTKGKLADGPFYIAAFC